MKIQNIKHIFGPNVFNHKSVSIMTLDLEEYTETESCDVPGFNENLVKLLPGLKKHRCSRGHEGGFIERLKEGTYFGHIIEHVALELSEFTRFPAYYGKTVYGGQPGVYKVAIESHVEKLSEFLLKEAVTLVKNVITHKSYSLKERGEEANRIGNRCALGPSTQSIVNAAKAKGIPWRRLNDGSLIQFGYGKEKRYIQATEGWGTKAIAVDISCDKDLSKVLLREACLPVPYGVTVTNVKDAIKVQNSIGGFVAIKPVDGHQGQGVSLNLETKEEISKAFKIASEYCSDVIVEEMFNGRDFRVIVVDGKFVAASERVPPQVVGNGKETIKELIIEENKNPMRGCGHEKPLTKIEIDEVTLECLKKQGVTLDTIPEEAHNVLLRESSNLSTGGMARDVTDMVHPSIVRICERAAEAVGLDICGIDLIVTDISQPLNQKNGIIEVNAAPGIRMHHHPSEGKARDVGAAIVNMMYPGRSNGRIPVISVTGTNGKTTVTKMVSHVLSEINLVVGTTTTGGIWVNKEKIAEGDTTGPKSAWTVLSNPNVEVAVLETARGGIARHGLAYDWSDIGVITNIQADHIGQDGIEDLDDLLHIKGLVAERVKEFGTLILNASDPKLIELAQHRRVTNLKRNLVYFSLEQNNEHIQKHVQTGGIAYYLKNGWIVEANGFNQNLVAPARTFPATLNGEASFQIENILATVAVCRSYGIEMNAIVRALKNFTAENNPGRFNLYEVNRGRCVVDYGHNSSAFKAISEMTSKWGGKVTAIVGVPGDRCDELVTEAAQIVATGFSKIIVKEDEDTRSRERGEIAQMIFDQVIKTAPEKECQIILNEAEALVKALREMEENETIVLFYDDWSGVQKVLQNFGAKMSSHEKVSRTQEEEGEIEKEKAANLYNLKNWAPSETRTFH